jgi:hypothetical protein
LKPILRAVPIVFLFLLALAVAPRAQAQSVSAYFGAGIATDSACTSMMYCVDQDDYVTGNPGENAPKMTGAFGKIGGDFMFKSRLGFGVESDFKFSQGDYLGLGYRPIFFDFNAIYHPIPDDLTKGHFVPEFEGGVGSASIHSYYSQSSSLLGNYSELVGASTHFQVHGAIGVKLYAKGGIFLKPQVDVRYIPNFSQFGSNFVPEFTVSLGYTFGRK